MRIGTPKQEEYNRFSYTVCLFSGRKVWNQRLRPEADDRPCDRNDYGRGGDRQLTVGVARIPAGSEGCA